jgi:ribosomal protein L11 methyltransferase
MRWIEAAIPTVSGELDALCERLGALGGEGISIEDEADFQRFLAENRQYWDYVDDALARRFAGLSRVKFYLQDDEDGRAELARIRGALGREIEISYMEDEDWENGWKRYYEPIPVGQRLLIVPEWLSAEAEGRTVLRLDPGIAFGTGSHPTTKMCLEALETVAGPGKRALDLGCGSGILGIAALLLGCDAVTGCDIDPKAPEAAVRNAALNGIGADRFSVCAGDLLADEGMRRRLGAGYAIVLANIVADVIIPLSAFARRFLAEGGAFLCSGIIDGRRAEVEDALRRNGFTVLKHYREDEWNCYLCQ